MYYRLGEQFTQSRIDGLCDDIQRVSQMLFILIIIIIIKYSRFHDQVSGTRLANRLATMRVQQVDHNVINIYNYL